MLDFSRCDGAQLSLVRFVIERLVRLGPVSSEDTMIVGAACRDILHVALGHGFAIRATQDVDVAVALADWDAFDELTGRLPPVGTNGIRYLVDQVPVDFLPFGEVEDPEGTVTPERRRDTMSVFGMREVFEHSAALPLGDKLSVRIPSPAGYTALKMAAWADRSIHGELRDAQDLGLALFWYAESPVIEDRLYGTEEGNTVLVAADMDVRRAAAGLLGRDVAAEIGRTRADELRTHWGAAPADQLVQVMRGTVLPGQGMSTGRMGELVEALNRGVWPASREH